MQGDVWRVDGARRHPDGGRAGGGSPRACIRRSAWSSPTAASTPSAATRSPGCTTSTATARPTFTNASATPTSRRPPATTSSAASSATRPGNFYTVSGKQGLIRVSPDGKTVETLATGFRNADGLGPHARRRPDRPQLRRRMDPRVDGLRGPPRRLLRLRRPESRPAPRPPARLPPARARQLQRRPGLRLQRPLGAARRARCSTSPTARGRRFLLLRDRVDGQPQGAVVPLPGEFVSGAHRGRFSPKDGQLYVSGHGRLGDVHRRRRRLPARPLHGRPGAAPDRLPRPPERRPRRRSPAPSTGSLAEAPEAPVRAGLELPLRPGLRLARAIAPTPRHVRPRPARRSGRPPSSPTAGRSSSKSPTSSPSASSICICGSTRRRRRSTSSPRSTSSRPRSPGFPGYRPRSPKVVAAHPILSDLAALDEVGAEPLA